MQPTELIENFKTQQAQALEEIKKLESELMQKKELYVKLQGAIEGMELLQTPKEESVSEDSPSEE